MKLFKADDFNFPAPFHFRTLEQVQELFALIANNKMSDWVNAQTTIYGQVPSWDEDNKLGVCFSSLDSPQKGATHQAKLLLIEEIKKDEV